MTAHVPQHEHQQSVRDADFLQRVIDATHDGIVAHRAIRDDTGEIIDFEMTFLNRAFREAVGANGASWVGKRLRSHLPNALSDGRYQLLLDAITTGVHCTADVASTFLDGSVHRLSLSAVPSGDDVVVSLRDVTQEHEAITALAESEQRYRELVEHQAELVCRFLPDTTILFVNEAYARYHGRTPNELIGTKMLDLVPDARRDEARAVIGSLSPERTLVTDEGYLVAHDGTKRWQQWTTSAVVIEGGRVTEIQTVGIDITARKVAETAIRARSEVLALVSRINQRFIDLPPDRIDSGLDAALNDLGDALSVDRAYLVVHRPDGAHLDMSHEWCARGVSSVKDVVTGSSVDGMPEVARRLRAGEPVRIESVADLDDAWQVERKAYGLTGVNSTLVMPIIASGNLVGCVGFDVTGDARSFSEQEVAILSSTAAAFGQVMARRDAENEVRRSERRYRALVDGVPDLLVRVSDDDVVLDWRPPSESDEQASPVAVVGRPLSEVFPELLTPVHRAFARDHDGEPQVDAFDVDWGESTASFEARVTIAGNEAIAVVRDVTAQQRLQTSLLHQATHDALTGLANRRLFSEHLDVALAHGRDGGGFPAVLFIDLDQFKVLNDSQGHDVGDTVLRVAARRLTRSVRPGDIVARLGGDEFAVLSHRMGSVDQAVALAERIVAATAEPIEIDGDDVVITASIGVVVGDADSTTASVLRDADAAMYQAKAKGRRRVERFTDEIREAALARHQVERDLRRGLENEELELYYQPLWSLVRQSWVGVEALVRWNHPIRGLLSPAQFLTVAEDAGLMPRLGEWVLDRACADLGLWRRGTAADLRVWVNLSGDQLMSPDLADEIEAVLERYEVGTDALGVEVTETAVVDDIAKARSTLSRLRSAGIGVALDDFGTGLSSLTHLDALPLDVVKLDGAFVAGAGSPGRQRDLVDGIVTLVRRLGLEVLAERVESPHELDALRELGVDSLQGFYLGLPMPAAELAAFLTDSRPFMSA